MRTVGKLAKLHLYLKLLPLTHINAWALPPVRSAVVLDSHRSSNPTLNCICEGSKLYVPYENHPKLISSPGSWKNYLPWNQYLVPKRLGNHWCIEHHSRVCQENRVGYRAQLESLPAKWLTEIPETLAFLHRCAVLILSLSPTSLICPQVCPLCPRPSDHLH